MALQLPSLIVPDDFDDTLPDTELAVWEDSTPEEIHTAGASTC